MVQCLWLGCAGPEATSSCPVSAPHPKGRPCGARSSYCLNKALRHGPSCQGRGGSTGYDNAVALPARADAEELAKENLKSTVALKGQAVFSVAKVGSLCLTCVPVQACLPCVVAAASVV